MHELFAPFRAIENEKSHNVSVKVTGGGHSAQIDAIRLGIAKCLATEKEELKSTLRRAGQLSRDTREKERKKFGLKGARKQRQFTKR
jgi:small subunit ribosomal protein S9